MLHISCYQLLGAQKIHGGAVRHILRLKQIEASPQPVCAIARGLLPIQEACATEEPVGETIRQGSIWSLQQLKTSPQNLGNIGKLLLAK